MKNRIGIATAIISVIVLTLIGLNLRSMAERAPRIRVGPLRSQVPMGDSMRIFALGDTGTGGEAQKAVAAAMEQRCLEHKVDALFLLGDNIYSTGVSGVDDLQWQTKVFGIYGSPCLKNVPIYPVLGNHDYKDNPQAQIEYSLKNPRWKMPNRFYAVDFGYLLKLIAYDSQYSEFCFKKDFCTLDFLLSEMKKTTTVWRIVTAHHPIASASDHGNGVSGGYSGGLREWLLQPLLCDHVDLYISGHSHHLEYRELDKCRLDLVVSGGGGADLYKVIDDEGSTFAKSEYGFFEITLDKREMNLNFISKSGEILFSKTKISPQH